MVTSIVLSAGESSRMGNENKLLLPYSDSTVLYTTLSALRHSSSNHILLITGKYHAEIVASIQSLQQEVDIIYNQDYPLGMSTSIILGVKNTNPTHGLMICLGDMPKLTTDDYNLLINAYITLVNKSPYLIVAPRYKGKRGNPVIFSPHYRNQILQNNYPEGCRNIIKENEQNIAYIEMSTEHCLIDIDTKEDYLKLI